MQDPQNMEPHPAWPPSPGAPPTGSSCPRCHSHTAPYQVRQISTAGWITFGVLMFICLPLFWIGLLIKEDQTFCSTCGFRLG